MRRLLLFLALTLLIGCVSISPIAQMKTEENAGKTFTVKGTVTSAIKIGLISGYVLEDETGKLNVASKRIPGEGDTVTVKGVLMKDNLFGYYLKAD